MASKGQIEVRPRTTGEILDDAWRLVLADAPLLLTLTGFFTIPLAVGLLALLTHSPPGAWQDQLWLPALIATVLPLTGLSSGASQEAFRCWTEDQPATLGRCLIAALRHGLDHAAARVVVLSMTVLGMTCLLLPGLLIWAACAPVHALIADGKVHWFEACQTASREMQRNAAKAVTVTVSRLVLLLFALVNLHLLVRVALWIADDLAGFDGSVAAAVLEPANPVYDLALVLTVWLLLAPYAEACNYLLQVDARARYEGLDLWYRAQRLFPKISKERAGVFLLVIGSCFLGASFGRADDERLGTVRVVRKELAQITREVQAAEPYPGGERWQTRLQDLAGRLQEQAGRQPQRYRWFGQAAAGFGRHNRNDALQALAELDQRLALIEESLTRPDEAAGSLRSKEETRSRLPPAPDHPERRRSEPPETAKKEPAEAKRPVRRDEPGLDGPGPRAGRGPGLVAPVAFEGLGTIGWMLVAGLLIAFLVYALLQWSRRQKPVRPKSQAAVVAAAEPSLEALVVHADQKTVENLWRQADELARKGQFLEAVRTLYLGVLALLHRGNLIRFERTRTNGEYVRQLRAQEQLHEPFRSLTHLFELKWYGERSCQPEEYSNCRKLAEEIRQTI